MRRKSQAGEKAAEVCKDNDQKDKGQEVGPHLGTDWKVGDTADKNPQHLLQSLG